MLQNLECCVHFILIALTFSHYSLSFFFLDWIKDKKWNKLKRKYISSAIPFPMQLHRINVSEISQYYDCPLQLLLVTIVSLTPTHALVLSYIKSLKTFFIKKPSYMFRSYWSSSGILSLLSCFHLTIKIFKILKYS